MSSFEIAIYTGITIGWIGTALITAYAAQQKGYEHSTWLFAGLNLGIIALIGVIALPDKHREPRREATEVLEPSQRRRKRIDTRGPTWECPSCRAMIPGGTEACTECGYSKP